MGSKSLPQPLQGMTGQQHKKTLLLPGLRHASGIDTLKGIDSLADISGTRQAPGIDPLTGIDPLEKYHAILRQAARPQSWRRPARRGLGMGCGGGEL